MSTTTTDTMPSAHADHQTSLGLSNLKLGMWTFLGSECLFFGAFISTHLIYIGNFGNFPEIRQSNLFDIPFTSVSTLILLMSSLAMVLALAAIQQGNMRSFRIWTLATALMGAVFMSGQVYEFTIFYAEGMRLETSPFTSSFFVLTGFHGFHVFFGIMMLVGLWAASLVGKLTPANAERVEYIGLYWHFVDIVWIVLFTVVYLIPAE